MAHPMSVEEAAAEVRASDAERQSARQALTKIELELWDAQRLVELSDIRYEEATRVLIEVTTT